jgi:DNA-binding GntR family transcriptional regulator
MPIWPQNGLLGHLGNFPHVSVDWTAFEPQHGPVARYRQVAAFVRSAVEAGELKQGDALPTEAQLSDYMDVSVDTIRAALQLLRDDGLIVTSQGIGSFIA